MIVDDVDEMRLVLRMTFEADGFVVREAADADTAVEVAQSWPPDAALIDWRLGRESGIDLVTRLRHARFNGVIVVFTATADTDLEIRALAAGADDYVQKGADALRVIDTVRHHLGRERHL